MSRINHTLMLGIALVLGSASLGCSSTKDEMTKQLDDMKREITALRAEGAVLKDRLDTLETAPRTATVVTSEGEAEPVGDRPVLEVVHLSPEEEPKAADEQPVVAAPIDDSPPMDIVGDENGVAEVDPAEEAKEKAKAVKTKKAPRRWRPPARKPKGQAGGKGGQ